MHVGDVALQLDVGLLFVVFIVAVGVLELASFGGSEGGVGLVAVFEQIGELGEWRVRRS